MLKLLFLVPLFIPYLAFSSQYDNEINAFLFFQRYQNKIEKNLYTKKFYLTIPKDNCKTIIKVKNNGIIKSYEVNMCDKKIIQI